MHLETPRTKIFAQAWKELHSRAKLPNTRATHKHLQFLLLNIAHSMRDGHVVALACPNSKKTIVSWTRTQNPHRLTPTLLSVVNGLERAGYLIKIGSQKHFQGKDRKYSRIIPTPKLIAEIIETYNLHKTHVTYVANLVAVTKAESWDRNKKKIRQKVDIRLFKNPAEISLIQSSNSFLKDYNRFLLAHRIELSDNGRPISQFKLVRRVFCRTSLQAGGRFFGGFWQGLPSGKRGESGSRKQILINGEPTVELDYKSLHPHLLYQWENLLPPDDAYLLADWPRELVKKCILVTFNCKSFGEEASLNSVLKDKELQHHCSLLENGGYSKLRRDFISKNPALEKFLGKDVGVRLQRQDSDIAMVVMKRLMQEGILALCIHDSFICQAKYEEALRQIMMEAYKDVMQTQTTPLIGKVI